MVLLALAVVTLRVPAPPALPRPRAVPVSVPVPAPALVRAPVPAAEDVPDAEARRTFTERVGEVALRCDLPIDVVCGERACVGVLVGPDLDRLSGWVSLVAHSPRFVLSTVARDLGVPAGATPCGAAVSELARGGGVAAVELPDGTEIWCTSTGPQDAGQALCSDVARERLGPEAARFGEPRVRQLAFER
jgi:hypothetical protein